MSESPPIRIANCSGFYGDRLSAAREMVEDGPVDVLTGEYLAELTMLILARRRAKDPTAGYASTFLQQLEDVAGLAMERGVKIVANAGGLNPAGLADEVRALLGRLGIHAQVAHIEGDDLLPKLEDLQRAGNELCHMDNGGRLADRGIQPVAANAYLGGWGIATALSEGADIVICPRVTDASLVVGPAAWRFGWALDDWDRLAGAIVAGHVIECGAQATGGNYSFFQEVPGLDHCGFPIAEVYEDGSSVITKHEAHGGLVSVGTVTAQLLYEIQGPRYFNPDAVARFDSIHLAQVGEDRVRISGVRGEPAPSRLKASINYVGGFRNSMTFVLTGLDIEQKADLARAQLFARLGGEGRFEDVDVQLIRADMPDPPSDLAAIALLRVTVKDQDQRRVGRPFSNAIIEMALGSYPGFFTTSPPQDASPYGVFWPALIPADAVDHMVVLADGRRIVSPEPSRQVEFDDDPSDEGAGGPLRPGERVPLGRVVGARSGDKGGNANVGLWTRSDVAYEWLRDFLTVERFKSLLPEASGLAVSRYPLPNMRALNFVVHGLLDEGVASTTRFDAQAKGLGEYVRSRLVEVPAAVLEAAG